MKCRSAGVKRAIRRNELRLNGAIPRTDTLVRLGDNLQVVVKIGSAPVKPHASEGKQGLDVVYEDDHFACVVKPQVNISFAAYLVLQPM